MEIDITKHEKFIKIVMKQLQNHKSSLSMTLTNDSLHLEQNKMLSIKDINFDSNVVENFLRSILIDGKKKWFSFDHSTYQHPLKNIISSITELGFTKEEQTRLLDKFFTFQNTHDFLSHCPHNTVAISYIKPDEIKDKLSALCSLGRPFVSSNLRKSIESKIVTIGLDETQKIINNHIFSIVSNYKFKESYQTKEFENFLMATFDNHTYITFKSLNNSMLGKNQEKTQILFLSQPYKHHLVFELEIEKLKNQHLFFNNKTATDLFNMVLSNSFSSSKMLNSVDKSEAFIKMNNTILMVFQSDKSLDSDMIQKDVISLCQFLDENVEFNKLPSLAFNIKTEFLEDLTDKFRKSLMNQNLSEKLKTNTTNQQQLKI